MNDDEIKRIYNKPLEFTPLEFTPKVADFPSIAEATRAQMIADGWRNCAQGQPTTQFCRLLHQAVEAERAQLLPLLEMAAPFVFAAADAAHVRTPRRLPVDELVDRIYAVLPELSHD